MATTKVGIAPMKVAQISKPGGDFEIVEREIPNPVQEKYASRCRLAAFVIAMCL